MHCPLFAGKETKVRTQTRLPITVGWGVLHSSSVILALLCVHSFIHSSHASLRDLLHARCSARPGESSGGQERQGPCPTASYRQGCLGIDAVPKTLQSLGRGLAREWVAIQAHRHLAISGCLAGAVVQQGSLKDLPDPIT